MKFSGVLKIRAPTPCFRVATPNIGVAGGGRVRQSQMGCRPFPPGVVNLASLNRVFLFLHFGASSRLRVVVVGVRRSLSLVVSVA